MRTLYVDAGVFIAVVRRRDAAHDAAARVLRRAVEAGDRLVTSDAAVGEALTRLRYDAGLDGALRFAGLLDAAVDDGWLVVRESDRGLRARAVATLRRYDGLRLSYADTVGAGVAAEVRADAVLTFDADFAVLGFAVEPSGPDRPR